VSIYSKRFHQCRTDEYGWHGHRLVVMENSLLRIGILASKGADIVEFRYKPRDMDVLWHAPQAISPPGQYISSVASSQGAFLDYYAGGWQEIFPNGGPATKYKGAELGEHGEVALLPWDVRVCEDSPQRVEIEFSVETFRTPFRLTRRMILEEQASVVQLKERVTNLGEEDLALAWGHHPVFGAPFLEAGCVIDLPPCEATVPEYARGLNRRLDLGRCELAQANVILGKERRTEDVVLFTGFREGWAALRNPSRKLAVGFVWEIAAFPYLWCWQVFGGSWGYPFYGRTYNVGIEPFNCPILPLDRCIEEKCARMLPAGQEIASLMEVGVFEVGRKIAHLGFGSRMDLGE
jgi:Domain of unknown function (DUF4432)